jgi:CHAT domain-containing protein
MPQDFDALPTIPIVGLPPPPPQDEQIMFIQLFKLVRRFIDWATQPRPWRSPCYPLQRSLLLSLLFCLFALGIPITVAQVSRSTPMVSTQSAAQLIEQGKAYYQAKQFEQAATAWQQAADQFARTGDPLNQAMALSNLSLATQHLGKWEDAHRAIAQSLTLLESQPKSADQQRILAATLDIQGQQHLSAGKPADALTPWQRAAQLYQSLNLKNAYTQNQINQAQALQDVGLYPKACQNLLQALSIESPTCRLSPENLTTLRSQPFSALQLTGLQSLGNVLRILGQPEQSQQVLLTSLELAQDTQPPIPRDLLDRTYLGLGNTAQTLGYRTLQLNPQTPINLPALIPAQPETCRQPSANGSAAQYFQQAGACFQKASRSNDAITRGQAQLNLLGLLIDTQQGASIPDLLPQIQSTLQTIPASRTALAARLKWSQLLMCLQASAGSGNSSNPAPILAQCNGLPRTAKGFGTLSISNSQIPEWSMIQQQLKDSLRQAQQLGDTRGQADTLGYLGGLSFARGNWGDAQQWTEKSLSQVSTFDAPDVAYRWLWQLGRLHQQQGHTQEAIAAYRSAFNILKSLRGDLVAINPDVQFTFRDAVEPIYRELVSLLLTSDQPEEKALKESRDVIEALQLAELNNFFQQACLEARPQPIDQIDPKAAVLYGIILPDRLAVISALPGQPLHYHAVPLAVVPNQMGQVEQTVADLDATLNPFITSPDPLKPNQQLYDWLIRPIESDLNRNGIKTLVFVLDGALRSVPLAALHDGQRFLVETYNVALTPGLQLLSPRTSAPKRFKTLAGGLAAARQGFPPLPDVQREMQEISEALPTDVFLDEQFTSDRLQKAIVDSPYPVVHLATHAQFSSRAENTFLLTWDERINVNNLDVFLRERERRLAKNPIELLILSACQTAAGDNRATLGLAGVALRSGARSTLATLWAVQDKSTADLMAKFYNTFNQVGVGKAEALRQAQLSLIRSPQTQYHHPFYWAPFVLVGNWL